MTMKIKILGAHNIESKDTGCACLLIDAASTMVGTIQSKLLLAFDNPVTGDNTGVKSGQGIRAGLIFGILFGVLLRLACRIDRCERNWRMRGGNPSGRGYLTRGGAPWRMIGVRLPFGDNPASGKRLNARHL